MAMLQVTDLKVNYGVIQAIKGVSFEVNEGEVIALIGANGAGKTTILHTVTGLIAPKSGKIEFEGKDITKMPAHKIVTLGMAHVPEGRRVFADLSVYENLLMGAFTRKDKDEIAKTLEMVFPPLPYCLAMVTITFSIMKSPFYSPRYAFLMDGSFISTSAAASSTIFPVSRT